MWTLEYFLLPIACGLVAGTLLAIYLFTAIAIANTNH